MPIISVNANELGCDHCLEKQKGGGDLPCGAHLGSAAANHH